MSVFLLLGLYILSLNDLITGFPIASNINIFLRRPYMLPKQKQRTYKILSYPWKKGCTDRQVVNQILKPGKPFSEDGTQTMTQSRYSQSGIWEEKTFNSNNTRFLSWSEFKMVDWMWWRGMKFAVSSRQSTFCFRTDHSIHTVFSTDFQEMRDGHAPTNH